MQVGQRGPWLRTLLGHEHGAGFPVQAQRVAWPAAAVQRLHLVRHERLVERVLRQQAAELSDEIRVPAELQLAPHALQDRRPAFFFQAVPHPGHPVAADPGQRLTAPEPVGLAQELRGAAAVAAGDERVGLPAQPAEPMQVDHVGVDIEHIAGQSPRQPDAVADGLTQGCPQPRDVDGQALPGLRRRLGIPQPVDQRLRGHDRPRRQQQDREDASLPRGTEVTVLPCRPQLRRPEDPKFHDRLALFHPLRQASGLLPKVTYRIILAELIPSL